jgi:hypothetical protein
VHNEIISAVTRLECVSDRMSYIILRGRWCYIIVQNIHVLKDNKTDETKDGLCEDSDHGILQLIRQISHERPRHSSSG